MKRIYQYVVAKLLAGILLSTLILSCLGLVSSLIRMIGKSGADLDIMMAVNRIGRLLPYMIYEMLPLGCIIGLVVALRSLVISNEMVIMRCLGLSGRHLIMLIASPVLAIGLLAILWWDHVVIPLNQSSQTTHNQVWIEKEQEILHIARLSISPQSQLIAERLIQFATTDERETLMMRASGLVCDDKICRTTGVSHKGEVVEIVLAVDTLNNYGISPHFQRLSSLWQQRRQQSTIQNWYLWQRLTKPLFFIALALLMAVFVLYSSPRTSIAGPIIIAIGLGFLADTLLKITSFSAMLYQAPLWFAFMLPLGLTIIITVFFIMKKT